METETQRDSPEKERHRDREKKIEGETHEANS